MNPTYQLTREALYKGLNFLLTTHVNPDGDAIGSVLGLKHALESMSKSVVVMLPSPCPDNLLWMPAAESMKVWTGAESDLALLHTADTIVVLDLNTLKRLGSLGEAITSATSATVINIDHHAEPDAFATVACIDVDAPSTTSMLVEMISDEHLTSDAARCLYTGIMTDTGSFRFPRTTSQTFEQAARLLDAGADPVEAYERTINVNTFSRINLLGAALNSMQLHADGRLCIMTVSLQDLSRAQATIDDTDGFVQHTLSITGVEMGILFVELTDTIKVSFRSKGATHVRVLAATYGGGGHDHAAGARFPGETLAAVIDRVVRDAVSVFLSGTSR